jgi:hypothetical protein
MERSGQLHGPPSLSPRKEPLYPVCPLAVIDVAEKNLALPGIEDGPYIHSLYRLSCSQSRLQTVGVSSMLKFKPELGAR